jgi:RNA polymerase sigma-70 factor, ECF subfamily
VSNLALLVVLLVGAGFEPPTFARTTIEVVVTMQHQGHSRDCCDVRAVSSVKRDIEDPLVFEEFYRSEFPRLVRSMYLLVPDLDEAQELAQEAMVRVYERWDRVSVMESPGGYLYRVATNLNRRRIRSIASRARGLLTLGALLHHEEADPGRQDLADAISSLSVRLREAFMLVDWLGMDSVEAAHILRIEPASVRSRVQRARRELRAQLIPEEQEDG